MYSSSLRSLGNGAYFCGRRDLEIVPVAATMAADDIPLPPDSLCARFASSTLLSYIRALSFNPVINFLVDFLIAFVPVANVRLIISLEKVSVQCYGLVLKCCDNRERQ